MCGAPVSSTGQALRVLSADSAAAEGPRRSSSRATAQSNRPFEPGRSGGSRELLASAKRARSSRLKPLPQQRLWREATAGPGLALRPGAAPKRTDERRVGNEGVSKCRSRVWPDQLNKKKNIYN